ncbi:MULTISPECIES: RrF2 family transcriptional regulator [Asaia]|uniref:Rrf2 family transcriptional regulator n=2 Tax=Asaia TaxID=91914 RepID=A0ABQ1MC65_9PROT|nr:MULTISPECIES: Rrf2 family transcriptional regulator [Asaia]GBR06145.1 Rrf2 family transcriptional regulator [Asaia siamensis NRIC 0323]GBR12267.1 Rrf2 family transcriptional regulator [Asaia spathodeae NBRC 105894]GGC35034.1 Rrf2 family transcriptional regulator [Asaia siamensis]
MYLRRDRAMIAVIIMVDVAFHAGRSSLVSGGDIAERAGLARRGIEPLLQALSRSGLLESVRGPRGGYRLGRPQRDIGLDEIVRVVVSEDAGAEEAAQGTLYRNVIEPCWQVLDETVRSEMAALTLEEMVRRAEAAGLRRPVHEPISFSI